MINFVLKNNFCNIKQNNYYYQFRLILHKIYLLIYKNIKNWQIFNIKNILTNKTNIN